MYTHTHTRTHTIVTGSVEKGYTAQNKYGTGTVQLQS